MMERHSLREFDQSHSDLPTAPLDYVQTDHVVCGSGDIGPCMYVGESF